MEEFEEHEGFDEETFEGQDQDAYRFIRNTAKLLSNLLRNRPEDADLKLSRTGWTDVREMISKVSRKFYPIDFELVKHIVFTDDKNRFMLNDDMTEIRVRPGGGMIFDLGLLPVVPPEKLYYAVQGMFLDDIAQWGINKMNRQYVHLSPDPQTALEAASKKIGPVVLEIDALDMYDHEILFFQSDFDVWLTDHVPSQYISMAD